uniref:Uncharacterized protein n=1 Tax=Arundo donax TaxID=35708 RepID=A0A0A9HFW9_ARUDO
MDRSGSSPRMRTTRYGEPYMAMACSAPAAHGGGGGSARVAPVSGLVAVSSPVTGSR